MKFSIIIPLYNKAPYICKALKSVFAQTYTEYEVIIVDDGSTDGSFDIAKQFIDKSLMIKGAENSDVNTHSYYNLSPISYKLIRQANSGVSVARNAGVAQSSGDYVAFLDADDWWESTYLERMAQLIADYPDAGLYASNYYYHKDGKNMERLKGVSTGYINYPKTYFETFAMPIWTGAAIVKKRVFDDLFGFNARLWMSEDFDLWIRISLKYPIVFLDELLAYYNQDVQFKWRALGKLYPPHRQFAFNADYLIPFQKENEDVRHVVDMVKIMCLKQYYISKEYHRMAKLELAKIEIDEYKKQTYASYLWQPLWKLRLMTVLKNIYNILKNK